MKKISILHIDYDDLHNTFGSGGQAMITKKLYQDIPRNKRVTVLTGNYPGAKTIKENNITYTRLGIGSMGPSISLLSFWALIPFAILRMQKKYDIIIEFFTAPFSVSLGFLIAHKPYLAVPTFLGAKQLSEKYLLPLDVFEKIGLRKIKHFLVPSEFMAKKIKSYNPSASVYILPYGCDTQLQKTKTIEKEYVLFLGRIDMYNKGLDVVIKGWKTVIQKHPTVTLLIAGNGKSQDEERLAYLIKENELENNICLLGRVTGDKKIQLLATCLFTIVPSRFETFCLAALESLAIGKPVVTSMTPGLSWIPHNTRISYPTNDPKAFANACLTLIEDKAKRKKLSKAAKEFTKNRSWKKVTKEYYQLLRNFIYQDRDTQSSI